MTRPRKQPSPPRSPWPDRLEPLALLIVLAVVCARAMVQERPDFEQLHVVQRLQEPGEQVAGPGPTMSLVFDGLILAAMACCAVAAAIRGRWASGLRGIGAAVVLMVLAAILSLPVASNLRLALNESIDRIAAVLVLVVVAQTVRRWWQVRLVLAAVGATGVAFAAFCVSQVHERETTRAWIQQQKDQAVRSGRISPDDPTVRLLELRAASNEASGFFSHSNIAGSTLMVCGLATVALGVARLRARRRTLRPVFGVVALLAGAAMALGLFLTHSRGAIVAGLLCGLGWVVSAVVWWRGERLRAWARRRWSGLVVAGWVGVLALVLATVALGMTRGLPGASLAYRWFYWTGAMRMVAAHPWTGVGAGNFDRHYVRYKPVEAPEEVKNPHNYLVTMAAEWGVGGLVSAVLLLVCVSIAISRPGAPPSSVREGTKAASAPAQGGMVVLWMAPLLATILVARSIAAPVELWLIWVLAPLVVWVVAYVALSLDSNQPWYFEDDPLALLGGLAAALLAAALHNTVSFSMTFPGSACLFFGLAGLAVAVRRLQQSPTPVEAAAPAGAAQASDHRRGIRRMVLAMVIVAASVMYWQVFVTPVASATRWLTRARGSLVADEVLDAYRRAAEADPLDSVAPDELARWAIEQSGRMPVRQAELAQTAVAGALTAARRDPEDNRHYRTLSSAYAVRYVALADPNDVDRAVSAAARAVALYPELPLLRVDYAETLVLQGTARKRPDLLADALEQLRRALELDDRRPPQEIRRLSPARRAWIEDRIRQLRGRVTSTRASATSSAPRRR